MLAISDFADDISQDLAHTRSSTCTQGRSKKIGTSPARPRLAKKSEFFCQTGIGIKKTVLISSPPY